MSSASTEQTIKVLQHALSKCEKPIDKAFYTGVIALLTEQFDTAKTHFNEVLALDKSHADARTNLGVVALKENDPQLAITYFSEALGYDEHHENARNNLAATFIHHSRFENALTHYSALLEKHPDSIEYNYNAGVAEMALGHLNKAQTHFQNVLKTDEKHSASLANLASIASRLNKTEDAIKYLKRAKLANPNDSSSAFMLDAYLGKTKKREHSLDYAKNLFDNYALHYEKHMVDTLNYQTPHHMAKLLHTHIENLHVERALDLGCGTGLSGVILRELCTHLTGVDLAPNMLIEAERKHIYDELIESDIVAFLKTNSSAFSLIIAADVLPYLGKLESLFQGAQKNLVDDGLFVFTHEISEKDLWYLQKTARFAHHPDYIHTLASQNSFNICYQGKHIARKHHDKDLSVMLYVLRKAT